MAPIIAQATVEPFGADRVVLHLPGTSRERTEFQRVADGWVYVITDAMVEGYLRQQQGAASRR